MVAGIGQTELSELQGQAADAETALQDAEQAKDRLTDEISDARNALADAEVRVI